MKTGRLPDSKAAKASGECNMKTGSMGVKNSTKKTTRRNHKSSGCEELFDGKENEHFSFKEPVGKCPELPDKDIFLMENRDSPVFHAGQTLASSKIKLQLFPINKETRVGLQKDGHNPYLELTLKGQKKISSVLKHLEKKWGSSNVAKGDPILFPYNIMENLSNCRRWTINDSGTTAADVYAAVGSPILFRLRYGWFYMHEPRSLGIPFRQIPNAPVVESGEIERGCIVNTEASYEEGDKVEVTTKECKATDMGGEADDVTAQKIDNASAAPPDNQEGVSNSLQQPSLSWIDSLTNVSIGGLLAEASLLGRFDTLDPKSYESNAGKQQSGASQIISDSLTNISIGGLLSEASLQGRFSKSTESNAGKQQSGASQLFSDSLDAFIVAQNSHPSVSRPSAEGLRTSILDAEETCHAFPVQKLASTAVDMQTTGSANSLNLPNIDKVNNQDGLSQNLLLEKSWTDLLLARSNDDERSLGLSGIKWNESLGPFDFGVPAKKIISGDRFSMDEFVKS
ncbi:hypothetical protein HN51_036997 [Arachis hypogaea]|uniref:TSL-kinase interacting protein 1 n=1 Tax=Arachis ipaensis TaxID=130454 RepID=UPI0007AF8E0F|nr:TSL-kinase interacting protein 1 [Arachis ipaensis]XP_020974989.1 TSL-kinase interacting protein 1 [Arachis ipaensis]XP_025637843.1 TSL-kinase interacting protein 1 [Arachis hypogaea]XP_025637845.1 TSL-kinase interacting protein 1 [Arachis hypogaea]QHO02468.1 TSL-kinase interacting protein [Arachis hypogaea]